jgi:hypothetical protein
MQQKNDETGNFLLDEQPNLSSPQDSVALRRFGGRLVLVVLGLAGSRLALGQTFGQRGRPA